MHLICSFMAMHGFGAMSIFYVATELKHFRMQKLKFVLVMLLYVGFFVCVKS